VVASAFLFGIGPSIFVSILSILFYDFFFVPPFYTLTITNPEYIVELIIFFATSVIVGEIMKLFRQQKEALRVRLENIGILEQMGRELLNIPVVEQILNNAGDNINQDFFESVHLIIVDILENIAGIVSNYLTKVFKVPNLILFRDRDGKLKIWARSGEITNFIVNDYAIADWVFNNGDMAGKGTKTLVASDFIFIPMKTKDDTVGVIALMADYAWMLPQDKYFISAIANLAAIAAEKNTRIIKRQ
jgi:two-component system sensor histidine kinase KdpD